MKFTDKYIEQAKLAIIPSSLTDDQIQAAKLRTRYSNRPMKPNHEHPDCIRIAVAWLSAQRRLKLPSFGRGCHPLKHIVESWGGRYVSMNDVEVAAKILNLQGIYPFFNISSRLTRPDLSRLDGIGEAMSHRIYCDRYRDVYSRNETLQPKHLAP